MSPAKETALREKYGSRGVKTKGVKEAYTVHQAAKLVTQKHTKVIKKVRRIR